MSLSLLVPCFYMQLTYHLYIKYIDNGTVRKTLHSRIRSFCMHILGVNKKRITVQWL
jgi:hypothetical protein